jgi:photosystem II stability/assembly factor-like uncharacterized protein/tetratricopeptide (TPR) repeat protein
MRPILLALFLSVALVPCAAAGDLPQFDDAALHAVQFVPEADGSIREGWAVGDDGVVWHTREAGDAWERQPTGVRASLRSVHFLTPYIGWIAGREELPNGGGSVGVLLYTRDGGVKWQRVTLNALPGLNCVRFLADGKTGFIAGDCTDQYPSGVFMTTDAGRSWQPLAGKRGTTWLAADFSDPQTGALGGAWDSLALLRRGSVGFADDDRLRGQGRAVRGIQLAGQLGVAVGQGALVLINSEIGKHDWALADLNLPTEVRADWDFHGVALAGHNIWVVGRPGSAILHSGNSGGTWEVVKTKQPLPLNGVFFADEKQGWAVGEFGSILKTADGGQTWTVQRRGGERAAILCVHARPTGVPLEALATLGADEGYLITALRVVASDPASAAPARSTEAMRLQAATRLAGGAAGEALWQFPLPQHLATAEKTDLVKSWDRRHGGAATDELMRQLVLALRVWRPDAVITDYPILPADNLSDLVQEAARYAIRKAADPKAFPEQIEALGLRPWQAKKLYAHSEGSGTGQICLSTTEPSDRLMASPRDYVAPAANLLADMTARLPESCYFYLRDKFMSDDWHGDLPEPRLMYGIVLAPGGEARRKLREVAELAPEARRAIQTRRNLQALAELKDGLGDPNKLLAQIGPSLKELPDDQGAPAAFAVASNYARQGQWALAREVFLLMADRYPMHPLSADACRWLIRHSSSSEARHRQELGQFIVQEWADFQGARNAVTNPRGQMPHAEGDSEGAKQKPQPPPPEFHRSADPLGQGVVPAAFVPGDGGSQQLFNGVINAMRAGGQKPSARQWYENVLAFETKLASFGPLFSNDPSIQFCLNAARRNLGDVETARNWYAKFSSRQPEGPWRDAALAELWLLSHNGAPPKPVVMCRQTDTRPVLDGKLDDKCWQDVKPLVLRDTAAREREGDPKKHTWADDYPTEVYLTYDKNYLYIGLVCRQPKEKYVKPVSPRPRDADVRPFDHVNLLLNLDRNYSTYYHLQFDQRGCTCEDCWGDMTWNPKYYVAVQSEPGVWQIEAAIPFSELSGEPVTLGKTWACNVVRVVPGQGVQAFSLPADAQPRPEGMGLITFVADPRHGPAAPAAPMKRE